MGSKLIDHVAPATAPLPENVKMPKLLIPTTSGTGSEVSNTAVVIVPDATLGSTKTWITGSKVLADPVIIDPELMKNLPPRVTAASGLDALSHCAEAVLSKQANAYSDALALEAIRLVAQNLRVLKQKGMAIIFISHRIREVFDIAEKITVLKDGTADQPRPWMQGLI